MNKDTPPKDTNPDEQGCQEFIAHLVRTLPDLFQAGSIEAYVVIQDEDGSGEVQIKLSPATLEELGHYSRPEGLWISFCFPVAGETPPEDERS